jgi:hypothetical protein
LERLTAGRKAQSGRVFSLAMPLAMTQLPLQTCSGILATMRWTLLATVLCGCAWTNNGTQKQAVEEARSAEMDAESWQGRPLIDLETQPMFSTLPKQVTELSDGSQMWSFQRCRAYEMPAQCASFPIGSVQFTNCTGGRIDRSCCIRQFRVVDKTVKSFRALGPCVTGCQVRPGGCMAEHAGEPNPY